MNNKLINFPRFEKLPPYKPIAAPDKTPGATADSFGAATKFSNTNPLSQRGENFEPADVHPELKRIKKNASASQAVITDNSQLQQGNLPNVKMEQEITEISSRHGLTQTMKDFVITAKARINLGEIKGKTLGALFGEQFPGHSISSACANSLVNNYKLLVENQQNKLSGIKTEEGIIEISSFHQLTQAMKDFLINTKARINMGEIKGKTLTVLFNQQFPGQSINSVCANSFVTNYKSLVENQQNKLSGIKTEEGIIEINSSRDLTQTMKDFLLTTRARINLGEIKNKSLDTLFNQRFPSYRISSVCTRNFVNTYKSLVKNQQNKLSGVKTEEGVIEISSFQHLTQAMKDFLINTKARINLGEFKGKTLAALFNQQFPGQSISCSCARNFVNKHNLLVKNQQIKLSGIKTEEELIEISSSKDLTQTMKDFLLTTKARLNLGKVKGKTLDVLFNEHFPSHRISYACAHTFVTNYKSLVKKEQGILSGIKTEEGLTEITSFRNLTQSMKDFLLKTKARINLDEIKGKTIDILFNEQFPGYNVSYICANGFVNAYKSLVKKEQDKFSEIKTEEGLTEIKSFKDLTKAMQDFLVTTKARINLGEIKNKALSALFSEQFPSHSISNALADKFAIEYKSQLYPAQSKLL